MLLLDNSWNRFAIVIRRAGTIKLESAIYHYAGTKSRLYYNNEVEYLYHKILQSTPWGQEQCTKSIEQSISRLVDRANQLEKVLSVISSGAKKKIFYGNETNAMQNLYKILPVSDGDYRIMDEINGSIEGILPGKTFDTLKNEQDKYVVFVLPQADGGHAMDKLNQLGLKIEEDYFVIPRLLMPQHGGYL